MPGNQESAIQTGLQSEPVLNVENLAVAYRSRQGDIEALRDVSFRIYPGETFGIVGESGCGKSTAAWAIVNYLGTNGYIKQGRIEFQGQELIGKNDRELRRIWGTQIAMVYQDPMQSLNPSLRISEQLTEVLIVHRRLDRKTAMARSRDMLARVAISDPDNVLQRYPHQLSGGQQQRVVIAMALLNQPALLIMDEPTSALDVTVEAAVLDLINELRRDFNTAIMFISHNLGVIARVSDRVGVLYGGEMVEMGSVGQIFREPRHPYTQGLLRSLPRIGRSKSSRALHPIPGQLPSAGPRPPGCLFAPRCEYAQERCLDDSPQLRSLTKGALVRCHFAEEIDPAIAIVPDKPTITPTSGVTRGPLVLRVNGLKKYYEFSGTTLKDIIGGRKEHSVKALENATFGIKPGETLGIVGESGSGKSTLVKTIIGLEHPTAGEIEFMGVNIRGDLGQRHDHLLRELQMVFQNPDSTLNPAFTVGTQLARPLRRFGIVPKDKIRAEVIRLLEEVKLGEIYLHRYPRQLSGGEKQRVGIARALATRPSLVLCDEPVSALDVSVQAALLNLLVDIQRERGTAFVIISHDLSVVRYVSDRVAVMYLGEIVEFGPVDHAYRPPSHPYTEALLSAIPVADPAVRYRPIRLEGAMPSAIDPPEGCRFHTRCHRRALLPDGGAICETVAPPWQVEGEHRILCHIPIEILRSFDPIVSVLD